MTVQLSTHFTLDEFTFSQTAARLGLDNSPPPEVLKCLGTTALGMEAVRKVLGSCPINISSGYRAPAVNAAVGGAKNSQHLTGQACDFTAPRFGTVQQVFDAIKASGIGYDQLIVEFGRWVHVSFSALPRRQALVIDANGTRSA